MALAGTAVAALVGALILEWLRVPAGALVGAAIGVAAVTLAPLDSARLPDGASFLAYVGIGWVIGQAFTRDVWTEIVRLAVPIVVAVAVLLVLAGVIAFALTRWWGLDPATAFLAASPGGLSQMSALAAAVSADASIVVTLHLVRVAAVLLLSPLIVRLLSPAS